MSSEPQHVMVGFQGDGAGEGELSWGQKENWATVTIQGSWLPLGGVNFLPPTSTMDEVVGAVRYTMSRYQPLRTLVRLSPEGRPTQVVFGSGQFPLEVVDADDTDDPSKVAEAVCDRYRSAGLDFTTEWPLRMAVVLHHGRPARMVALASHFAVDGVGLEFMAQEMATWETDPVAGTQPLAQAAWQNSPAGRRQNAAALRHWESILRTMHPRRFSTQSDVEHPRYWQGEFNSPALLWAARAISGRTGLGTSTVMLALFATALNTITGINPVVMRPIVGNRFRPGLDGVVCTVAQAGLCAIDVADTPFDEVLQRARRAAINAYKHAYFDHEDMVGLKNRIAEERGTELEISCFINDRHVQNEMPETGMPAADPAATATAVVAELEDPGQPAPLGTFRWVTGQDSPSFEPLFLKIDDIPDAIQLNVHLDTRCVSLADAQALALGMESIAMANAYSESARGSATVTP